MLLHFHILALRLVAPNVLPNYRCNTIYLLQMYLTYKITQTISTNFLFYEIIRINNINSQFNSYRHLITHMLKIWQI